MNPPYSKHPRILAIAPSTRGFGFALLEGHKNLADWGLKTVKGDKNLASLVKIKNLIIHYRPEVVVLEDTNGKQVRRSKRVRALTKATVLLMKKFGLNVCLMPREQVKATFFAEDSATKHAVAQAVAEHFPDELQAQLPPKRRPWMSEDARMTIFMAVALGLAFTINRSKESK